MNKLYRELQDICFKLIHPHRAEVLARALKAARGNRKELLTRILDGIKGKLDSAGLRADVFGREKSLYSIFCKMKDKRLSFSQVLDIYGFRVVVDNVPTCYLALGALHGLYKPVPGKFKDYIAIPKANGYQSLHTTLIGPYGTPVEVQIRTQEMHHVAQEGVAAHWLYKDIEESGADLQIKTHKWLQSLLEMQSGDSAEFFENVKIDLFPDEVYVFTPKARSWRCRRVRPWSTLPTRCIPMSAIIVRLRGSIMNWPRCVPNCAMVIWLKSLRRRNPARIRSG